MPLKVIGTDGGLLPAAVSKPYVMLMPGERVDVWADFSSLAGKQVILKSLSQLPSGWRPAHDLNEGACIQAMHPLHGRHVIVISESLEDYALGVTLHEHAEVTRNLLTRGIRVMKVTGPETRTIAGCEAVQFEIEGFHDNTWLKYLHTTIAGRRAFHQVIAWATQSRYQRTVFDALLDGFTELPGPDPIRRPPPGIEPKQLSTRVH